MEILKPIFEQTDGDRWAIKHMATVKLDPSSFDDKYFFEIRENIFTLSPNYIGTIKSIMGESIAPIVARSSDNKLIRCLGTGFFISCSGLLITAAHILMDPIERKYGGVRELKERTWFIGDLGLGVMIRRNSIFTGDCSYLFRPIEWATFLGTKTESPLPFRNAELRISVDTAICKVTPLSENVPYQPLPLIQPGIRGVGLSVGKRATAIGYSGMRDIDLKSKDPRVAFGDFKFDLHVSSGIVHERYPDNLQTRTASVPGPCFSATLKLPGGMSGSPIFDDENIYVHAVVSKGLEDANGPTNFGYGSMIASSLSLPIAYLDGKSIFDLIREGNHGIPQILIPDA